MTEPPVPPVADLLADQRARWSRGDRVLVEAYVRRHPALRDDGEALLDLIYNEVFLREQAGESPRRDEYLRRFPHLAGPIGAQFDVHQAIESEPDRPTVPGYELLAEVGRGGMGRVFRARHERLGTMVAVKALRAEHLPKSGVRKRFLAEARAAAALDHPQIIKVLGVGDSDGGPYFLMELIDGPSLEGVIRRGVPDVLRAARWVALLADAIHYAHGRGIIHRDLKPANVMVDAADRPRVMDFGMAKILPQAAVAGVSSTGEGTILGTASYMPPEQAGATGTVGPYSDVYSLGAILYALLTGRPPFDEGTFVGTVLKVRSSEPPPAVRSLRPGVPASLEEICHKCLNKLPADRYASAAELAEALRRFAVAMPPPPAAGAALCALETGETIPLAKEITVIGRAPECDLVLNTRDVSRRHCRVICKAGELVVEDLGSSQGTRVNGARVGRARLSDGDRLEVGKQVFQVRIAT
jgi:serine/threonine-protein kinase